jgi:hypothetical protein
VARDSLDELHVRRPRWSSLRLGPGGAAIRRGTGVTWGSARPSCEVGRGRRFRFASFKPLRTTNGGSFDAPPHPFAERASRDVTFAGIPCEHGDGSTTTSTRRPRDVAHAPRHEVVACQGRPKLTP